MSSDGRGELARRGAWPRGRRPASRRRSTPIRASVQASRRGRDRREPRVRGSPARSSSCSAYGALPPGAVHRRHFFVQPASVERLGRRLGGRTRRGAAALASNAHEAGGTSASARGAVAAQRAGDERLSRSIAPRSALRTRASRSSGWLGAQVEQDRRERRRRVRDARRRGSRPGRADAGGQARDARRRRPARTPRRRGGVREEVELDAPRYGAGPGRAACGVGRHERVAGRRRAPAGRRRHGAPSGAGRREDGVGVVELGERVRPGADRRLGRSRSSARSASGTSESRCAGSSGWVAAARKPAMGVAELELDGLARRSPSP